MKPEMKKLIIANLPYLLFVYLFGKLGQTYRLAAGADLSEKLLHLADGFSLAFESTAPSFHLFDLAVGVAGAVALRLMVYCKSKNAKKYRRGVEYGSARWGGPKDIAPYIDPVFDNNILLTQTERLTMNNRPKDPKTARNKNVLVIGGSGSGKTRFFVKPNLMQCVSKDYPTSFVITDPKGSLIGEVGQLLVRCGYRVKVLNTINFSKSIMGNLSGLFNTVNTKVGEIASDVGSTPQDWNGGIFSMLQNLSETVIVPIAAAILALVMCYELIDMIVEKNNMHDFDSSMFFRWIFKSAFAILIVTNTWNIVMGVFDATQQVVNQSAGVIIGDTSIDFDTLLPDLESRLEAMDIGPLLGLWFQTLVVGLTMNILSICIFLVTYGRMIEIYAVTALGPIPLATLGNAEWRGMGQNYLKSLLALGFQAFLIMVVVGIYAVLIQQIGTADDISGAIWGCMGYTVLLCFCLFKTGSISKAVFTAH